MKIFLTFARRAYDSASPELVHAWDEYDADENPRGYVDSRAAALEAMGTDLLDAVDVTIEVDDRALLDVFTAVPSLDATVTSATRLRHDALGAES